MLAIYVEAPKAVEICAVVDPLSNVGAWVNHETGRSRAFTYQDQGDSIAYSRNVPRLVERLVEEKTGRRIRFGCS